MFVTVFMIIHQLVEKYTAGTDKRSTARTRRYFQTLSLDYIIQQNKTKPNKTKQNNVGEKPSRL